MKPMAVVSKSILVVRESSETSIALFCKRETSGPFPVEAPAGLCLPAGPRLNPWSPRLPAFLLAPSRPCQTRSLRGAGDPVGRLDADLCRLADGPDRGAISAGRGGEPSGQRRRRPPR